MGRHAASSPKGNSVFVDDDFHPYEDQWAHLSNIRRLSRSEMLSIVTEAAAAGQIFGVRLPSTDEDDEPWAAQPSRRNKEPPIEDPLPKSVEVVLGNQVYYHGRTTVFILNSGSN
jgi:hypothetical protein